MYITTNHNLNQQQLQLQQPMPPPQQQHDDNLMSTSSSLTSTTTTSEDYTNLENNKNMSKKLISMCFGCGNQITDQFILRVAPDLEWHAKCLKCFECGQYLDENCTCFVRNGKTYCKLDYIRLFTKKCFKCKEGFKKNDFVMRAANRIYHVECFRCYICNKQLAPGDEFAPKEDGLLCKLDNELFEKHSSQNASSLINLQQVTNANVAGASSLPSSSASSSATSSSSASPSLNNSTSNTSCQNITNLQQMNTQLLNSKNCDDLNLNTVDYEDNQNCLSPSLNHPHQQFHPMLNSPHSRHLQQQQQTQQQSNSNTASTSSTSSSSSNSSLLHSNHHVVQSNQATTSSGGGGHHRKDKTTRVRTVLNEKQLHTLRTCYGANPRPDALMKEQLVEMTGLSPRVIRVWFQNKRCKDKKKTILIKQMQEQQKNRQTIGHGIPMIAGSPLRNDINNLGPGSQVEMQHTSNAYLHHQSNHLSWKQMSDGYNLNGQLMDQNGQTSGMNGVANQSGQLMPPYDQMMGFQSDEEDCFDQLSDQGGDDSVSSVGLDDTRLQQL